MPVSATPLTFQVSDGSTPAQIASGVITITITAQQPTSVAVNGGGTQTTAVSTLFGNPLSVLVKDDRGTPDGARAATFRWDSLILWDTATGRQLGVFPYNTGEAKKEPTAVFSLGRQRIQTA